MLWRTTGGVVIAEDYPLLLVPEFAVRGILVDGYVAEFHSCGVAVAEDGVHGAHGVMPDGAGVLHDN